MYLDQLSALRKTRNQAFTEAQYAAQAADRTSQYDYLVAAWALSQALQAGEVSGTQYNAQVAGLQATQSAENRQHNLTKTHAEGEAELTRARGSIRAYQTWVGAVGDVDVALAEQVKAQIDTLAGGLKSARDTLTTGRTGAAQQLVQDLADAEQSFNTQSAQKDAAYDNSLGSVEQGFQVSDTARENALREGKAAAGGNYVQEILEDHSATLSGASAPSGVLANLKTYQQQIATNSVSRQIADNAANLAYEVDQSAARLERAQAGGGPGAAHAAALGAANVGLTTSLESAERAYTGETAEHAKDYLDAVVASQTKATRDAIGAETKYSVTLAKANRDLNNALANAEVTRVDRVATAERDVYVWQVDHPAPEPAMNANGYTPEWQAWYDAWMTKQGTWREGAKTAANADYLSAARLGRQDFATTVGNGQITRVQNLGEAVRANVLEEDAAALAQSSADYASLLTELDAELAATDAFDSAKNSADDGQDTDVRPLDRAQIVAAGAARVEQRTNLAANETTFATQRATSQATLNLALAQSQAGLAQATADQLAPVPSGSSVAATWSSFTIAQQELRYRAAEAAGQVTWFQQMATVQPAYVQATTDAAGDESILIAEAEVAQQLAAFDLDASTGPAINQAYRQVDQQQAQLARKFDRARQAQFAQYITEAMPALVTYDTATIDAAIAEAVAATSAYRDYAVGSLGLNANLTALALSRDLAVADAGLGYAETMGAADTAWTGDDGAKYQEMRKRIADKRRDALEELAEIERDLEISLAPLSETRTVQAAVNNGAYRTAAGVASSLRDTAETQAEVARRSGDLQAQAAALAGLAAAIGVPSAQAAATIAQTQANYWSSTESGQWLTLRDAQRDAIEVFSTQDVAIQLANTTALAAADRIYAIAAAGVDYTRDMADAQAQWTSDRALADQEAAYQSELATHRGAATVGLAHARRDALAAGTPFNEEIASGVWGQQKYAADNLSVRGYMTTASTGLQSRSVGFASTDRDAGGGLAALELARNLAQYAANTALFTAQAEANYLIDQTLAAAQADYDWDRAMGWAASLGAVAAQSTDPWLVRAAATAAADAVFAASVVPADETHSLALATAERDYALVINPADLALAQADAQAAFAHDAALAEQNFLTALQASVQGLHGAQYPQDNSFPYPLVNGGTPLGNPQIPAVTLTNPAVPFTRQPVNSVGRFEKLTDLIGDLVRSDTMGESIGLSNPNWVVDTAFNPNALNGVPYAQELSNRAIPKSNPANTTVARDVPVTAPVEQTLAALRNKASSEDDTLTANVAKFDPDRIPVERVKWMVDNKLAFFFEDDRFGAAKRNEDYAYLAGYVNDVLTVYILEKYQPTKDIFVPSKKWGIGELAVRLSGGTPGEMVEVNDGPKVYKIVNQFSVATTDAAAAAVKWHTQAKANANISQFLSNARQNSLEQLEGEVELVFRMLPVVATTIEIADGMDKNHIEWDKVAVSFVSDISFAATLRAARVVKAANAANAANNTSRAEALATKAGELTQFATRASVAGGVGSAMTTAKDLLTDKEADGMTTKIRLGVTVVALLGVKWDIDALNSATAAAIERNAAKKLAPQTVGTGTESAFKKANDAFNDTLKAADDAALRKPAVSLEIQGKNCFAAGTPVLTPHGSVAIEELRIGDLVVTRNENDPESPLETRSVEGLFESSSKITHLYVAGRVLKTTAEHLFFVANRGWTRTQDLVSGDRLLSHLGCSPVVERVEFTEETAKVFNLRVTDCHTYFVGGESWEFTVWVHNEYRIEPVDPGDPATLWKVVDDTGDVKGYFTNRKLAEEAVTSATGTAPRFGPRRISDALYDELRAATPSDELRAMVNEGKIPPYPDPVLPGLTVTKRLQADHIVSMDSITRMEGFDRLTREQMEAVLNNRANFMGLSEAANKSKGSKSFADWTRHIGRGVDVDPVFRQQMMQEEARISRLLQKQIDDFLK